MNFEDMTKEEYAQYLIDNDQSIVNRHESSQLSYWIILNCCLGTNR